MHYNITKFGWQIDKLKIIHVTVLVKCTCLYSAAISFFIVLMKIALHGTYFICMIE